MLRTRDFVAVILAVWLVRMAWQNDDDYHESSANFHLAFYMRTNLFAELDIDGDGTVEAMVAVSKTDDKNAAASGQASPSYKLEVLDLKPLHRRRSAILSAAPFRPATILETEMKQLSKGVAPLKMITGQILLSKKSSSANAQLKESVLSSLNVDPSTINERTRHYFCGTDWHDAVQKCTHPCPNGISSQCPDGQMCYADTPCNVLDMIENSANKNNQDGEFIDKENNPKGYQLTPGGGLPSVVTLWSDGHLFLHSITSTSPQEPLQLKEIWSTEVPIELDVYDILLLGDEDFSTETNKLGRHGMIVLGGTIRESSLVLALDTTTGETIWSSEDLKTSPISLGLESRMLEREKELEEARRGRHSVARRRSRLFAPGNKKQQEQEGATLPNCWLSYRHSLMEQALPYAYWGIEDSKWFAIHLDKTPKRSKQKQSQQAIRKDRTLSRQRGGAGKHQHHSIDNNNQESKHAVKRWHAHRHFNKRPVYGRPNVLLSHSVSGIHVRSLKNGRPICHLSLMDRILYADINGDGTLDQIQAVTGEEHDLSSSSDQNNNYDWLSSLAKQVSTSKEQIKPHEWFKRKNISDRLCHILALSGLPAREELFSGSLCSASFARDGGDHSSIGLTSAPPVLTHNGQHVIVALSNGMISKFETHSGKRLWQLNGLTWTADFPTWRPHTNAKGAALLHKRGGKDANIIVAAPLLVAGEASMALISNTKGHVLASAVFPQPSIKRPILVDLSGDGTLDVIVISKDAIWGYVVVLRTGGSIMFRILVGLLFMGIALALIRNRMQGKDIRSTDAS